MIVIRIEIRKIEKAFGDDKWELRIGDVAGSTSMHNISKANLIKSIIDEIEEEVERIAIRTTKKINVRTTMQCYCTNNIIFSKVCSL